MGQAPQASERGETGEDHKGEQHQGEQRSSGRRGHRREQPARLERASAPVARLDEVRPRRQGKPAPRPAHAEDDGHLPAFLLRPVRAKA
jgi:hypothetical protein